MNPHQSLFDPPSKAHKSFASTAYTTTPPLFLLHYPIMKSFQAVIIAAIAVSAAAINEPVASPTAAIERELAEYERQLGTDITGTPTMSPGRPTDGVSSFF